MKTENQAKETAVKQKILVIDDEPSWLELLSFELGNQGFDVITATCASEGLIQLRNRDFDLLITDIRMPGQMDGVDLVRVFRKEKADLKVIFITGFGSDEKLNQMLRNEWTVHLRKPFNMDELNNKIQTLLQ